MLADRVRMGIYKVDESPIIPIPTPFVVEDFNRVNVLDDYYIPYSSESDFFRRTSSSYEGQGALVGQVVAGGSDISMYSTGTAKYYPSAGHSFSIYVKLASIGCSGAIIFGAQDINNYYYFRFSDKSTGVTLYKKVDGTTTSLADGFSQINEIGVYVKIKINWFLDGTIEAYIGASKAVSAVDDTFKKGGIGFRVPSSKSDDREVYFDYLVIEEWIG